MSNTDTLEPDEQPTEAAAQEVVQSEVVEAPPEKAIPRLADNASPIELLEFKLEVLRYEADHILDERIAAQSKVDSLDAHLRGNSEAQSAYRRTLSILTALEETA